MLEVERLRRQGGASRGECSGDQLITLCLVLFDQFVPEGPICGIAVHQIVVVEIEYRRGGELRAIAIIKCNCVWLKPFCLKLELLCR